MKWMFVLALGLGGCIKAPDLVIVDRATALERQAGGSYRQLQADLDRAAVAPWPVPLTRAQIEASGASTEPLALSDEPDHSDDAQVDDLLQRRCIGEANDGTLVETRASCGGRVDETEVIGLLERANRERWQVWRYLQARQPKASLSEVRRVWRGVHLQAVVCGAEVQRPDGGWEAKKC